MEAGLIVLYSPDLGNLKTVTVQSDLSHSAPEWHLDTIVVESRRYGGRKTATFKPGSRRKIQWCGAWPEQAGLIRSLRRGTATAVPRRTGREVERPAHGSGRVSTPSMSGSVTTFDTNLASARFSVD
jgi:hypothetical protein